MEYKIIHTFGDSSSIAFAIGSLRTSFDEEVGVANTVPTSECEATDVVLSLSEESEVEVGEWPG